MHPVSILNYYSNIPERRTKFEEIIRDMRRCIFNCNIIVKEIHIRSDLPQYFFIELLDLFKDIENITITENIKLPLSTLSSLKKLKCVKFHKVFNHKISRGTIHSLKAVFKKAETLQIHGDWNHLYHNPTIFKIDSTFTNLTTLTIHNPEILSSFQVHLPALVNVEFSKMLKLHNIEHNNVVEFFDINLKLKKLSIPECMLSDQVIQSIFKLNNLKYLKVDNSVNQRILRELNGIENRTIEHLEITDYFCYEDLKLFFNFCINLKIVEISQFHTNSNNITELITRQLIKLLIINPISECYSFPNLPPSLIEHFSVIKFNDWKQAFEFKKTLSTLHDWKFREDYPDNSRNYCITRS
ncbi:hypothetical protein CONCODRAFT_11136 [Conidiobolus coronatus NRRL 28638]|uniref:RNI-like protein n=1 Tax=Conidiobolus coronatus (strain ATCC 28846 / CBS 209.66 / NRRL 28638) TaxID=796925 RepID=A0A137NW58_CONC2|nr:hypothetical protein CONCODRAFT_11136 [Conidiobolus coronatus NRRL 28638]|eukprot:KXN66911.1 hypothetical protein CONCODRAFT_11136 [Conidiobolus coronatus NRRL 28638]